MSRGNSWILKITTIYLLTMLFIYVNRFLPEEQKGCRRKSRGKGDQLYIDKMKMRGKSEEDEPSNEVD